MFGKHCSDTFYKEFVPRKTSKEEEEDLDCPAISALRRAIAEVKQRWSVIGWVTKNLLFLAPLCFGTLSRWPRLQLQPLAPTNPHWARVVRYGPLSMCVIQKESLYPSSGDINRLMMMMKTSIFIINS
jgi:hypothetical protein